VFLLDFAVRLAELISLMVGAVLDLLHVWPVYLDLSLAFIPPPKLVTDLTLEKSHPEPPSIALDTETIAQRDYRERTRIHVWIVAATTTFEPPPPENRTNMATKVAEAIQPAMNHAKLVTMMAHAARESSAVSVPSTPAVTWNHRR
jgi:hypothetical protein